MSDVRIVSPSEEFSTTLRSVHASASGDLRYWREGMVTTDLPEVVRELANSDARVVVVGPGLFDDFAIDLIDALDRERPDIVKLLVAEPSQELWPAALRAGARDVITPTVGPDELREALDRALTTASRHRTGPSTNGDGAPGTKVITVVSPKGGVGKTTMATNLGIGLARHAPGEVVVIDLDLQFGGVAGAYGLTPSTTIADAVSGIRSVDATTLKVFLTAHPCGLYALCAPESLAQADDLKLEHLEQIVALLRRDFRYVVIDTSAGIDVVTLGAMELSSDLVIVSTTDVPCVHSVRRALDALAAIGAGASQHLVLNRADMRTGLGVADVESALGLRAVATVPDSAVVALALNVGSPVLESEPRSVAAAAIGELVGELAGAPVDRRASRAARRIRRRAKGQK